MCRSCGEFVSAAKEDGTWVPVLDECPDCGGSEFKHNETDTVVRADDSRADQSDERSGADP